MCSFKYFADANQQELESVGDSDDVLHLENMKRYNGEQNSRKNYRWPKDWRDKYKYI